MAILDTSFFYVFIILLASSLAAISQSQEKLNYLKQVLQRKTRFRFFHFIKIQENFTDSELNIRAGKKKKKYNMYFFWSAFLVITLPIALRYYTGADYQTYTYWFDFYSKKGLNSGIGLEYGFGVICFLCSKIFGNTQSMFFIMAFVTNFLIFKAIAYEAKRISMGAAVFAYGFTIYLWGYITIRNMLAISIVFFALRYLFENKWIKYFICVGIAILFHYTAFLFILVGPFYFEKLKKFRIGYSIAIFALLPVFPKLVNWLSDYVIKIIPKFAYYIIGFKDLEAYFDFDRSVWIKFGIFTFLFLLYYLRRKKVDDHIDLYLSFYLIALFLTFFSISQPLLTRFIQYFTIGQIFLVGGVVRFLGQKKIFKIAAISLLLFYGIGEIRNLVVTPICRMLPYQSVFDKDNAILFFEGNVIE